MVAPVVGVTETAHVDEAVEAVELSLSRSDRDYLKGPYEPTRVIGLR